MSLEGVKAGDYIYQRVGWRGTIRKVKVVRTTKTQAVISDNERYRISDGRRIGYSGYSASWAYLWDEEAEKDLSAQLRIQRIKNLQSRVEALKAEDITNEQIQLLEKLLAEKN